MIDFIAAIIEFFEKLFGLDKDQEPASPSSDNEFEEGERIIFYDSFTDTMRHGVITELLMDLDPHSPYSVRFDDGEGEEGTFSSDELFKE